jgi:hypothetical protein
LSKAKQALNLAKLKSIKKLFCYFASLDTEAAAIELLIIFNPW